MNAPPELLLAALVLAFWLHDSLVLLHRNEALLERRWGGGWRVRFGSASFTLARKEALLALLPPATPQFRLAWALHRPLGGERADGALRDGERAGAALEDAARAIAPFQRHALGLFASVLVLLPLALLARAGDSALVALLVVIYLQLVVAVACIWRARRRLAVSNRASAVLAAEMLLCPPLAPNLCRRLAQARALDVELVPAAAHVLAPQALDEVLAQIRRRLEQR